MKALFVLLLYLLPDHQGCAAIEIKNGFSYMLQCTKTLTAPFMVINGRKDLSCPFSITETFLKKTERKAAENDNLKKQLINPFKGDFPLTLIPAAQQNKLPIVFMISGDGGWTNFDQGLAEALASKGLSVLGLDAQKYFWNVKSPDQTSAELSLALRYYLNKMGKENLILAGYSFGASIVPFIANRLPADLKPKLKAVISLSPDVTADFEIHLVDLFNFGSSKEKYNVISEIKKVSPVVPVAIFGAEEGNKIKTQFQSQGLKVLTISGDHHFDKDYGKISAVFLKQIPE